MALPLTLLALLVLMALAGLVTLSARIRWLSGERALESLQARLHAESQVERGVANWDPLRFDTMAVGSVLPLPMAPAPPRLASSDSLLRLGLGLYLVRTSATRRAADGAVLTRDGAARLVRLLAPSLPDTAAVLAAGSGDVTGLGLVDGTDAVPAGWAGRCSPPGAQGVGIATGPSSLVGQSCSGGPCVTGTPPVGPDSTLTPGRLVQLGPVSLSELQRAADHRVAGTIGGVGPSVAAGACVLGDSLNWGDPLGLASPCSGYFPIIEAAPGTDFAGGHGQGVLIGSGSLTLSGNADFTGIVVGAGPVILRDQARVTGMLVALDSFRVEGLAGIRRSGCAIRRALTGSARPIREVERGWFRWNQGS
jgi:hypothetical protein